MTEKSGDRFQLSDNAERKDSKGREICVSFNGMICTTTETIFNIVYIWNEEEMLEGSLSCAAHIMDGVVML